MPCLSGNLLIWLGESLSGESKTLTGRDLVARSKSLVELQRGQGVTFAYRYEGINHHVESLHSLIFAFRISYFQIECLLSYSISCED